MRLLAAILILHLIPAAAQAENAEAKRRFVRGMTAYNLQRFSDALTEFQAAYEATTDPAFLFNIAQCQRQLGQFAAASKSYRAFLNATDSGDRERITALIYEMDQKAAEAQRAAAQREPESAPPALKEERPEPVHGVAATVTLQKRRPWYHNRAGLAVAGIGAGAAIAGGALLGIASHAANEARGATTLPSQRQWNNDAGNFGIAGVATLAGGGALMIAGIVILAVRR